MKKIILCFIILAIAIIFGIFTIFKEKENNDLIKINVADTTLTSWFYI